MKDTFHAWIDLNGKTMDEIISLIVTNKNLEITTHDDWIMSEIGTPDQNFKLLDFGCGVGRNTFGFSENKNWNIVGYDSDVMLENSKEYCKLKFNKNINEFKNVIFSSDWNLVSTMKFDCIYATLVFQHIFENDLSKYLQDIKVMSNRMVVMGRRFNDEIDKLTGKHKNTWKILENNGFYPCDADCKGFTIDGDVNHHITVCYKWNT